MAIKFTRERGNEVCSVVRDMAKESSGGLMALSMKVSSLTYSLTHSLTNSLTYIVTHAHTH